MAFGFLGNIVAGLGAADEEWATDIFRGCKVSCKIAKAISPQDIIGFSAKQLSKCPLVSKCFCPNSCHM